MEIKGRKKGESIKKKKKNTEDEKVDIKGIKKGRRHKGGK
jgi:hypothetical protein